MTASEPDSPSPRRPPTIELSATEVKADTKAPAPGTGTTEEKASETKPAAPSPGRLRTHAVGAVIGALIVAVIVAAVWMAGLVARDGGSSSTEASKPTVVEEISAELKRIEGAIAAQKPDPLAERMAAAEAQTKALADSLTALNRRMDDTAGAAQSALAQAKAAAAAAGAAKDAAQAGVQRTDINALSDRIAALDRAVKNLSDELARRTASADDRVARLIVATEALRAAVERGSSYQAELAAVKSLGVNASLTAPLEPFAAGGVPSPAALAHELSALVPSLLQTANPGASDQSFLERLESNAQRLVRITPVGAPASDDAASVIARINVDAAHADIPAALADIAKLPDQAKPVAAPWVKKAEDRNAAIAASRRIDADAFAALGKPGPQ
jgi:hypothetical protein